jgi:hypothetical protein
MRLIATRLFDLDDVCFVDRLYRRGDVYALHMAATPVDEGGWIIYNVEQVREWFSEAPEQIEFREAV